MFREKLRKTYLQKCKDKRAKEQQMIREKLRNTDLRKAKEKRRQEQHHTRHFNYDFQKAYKNFTKSINQYPEYICVSCSRMLYKKSVISLPSSRLQNVDEELHVKCLSSNVSVEGKQWLCHTCCNYLKRNKLPPQADANNLKLPTIPDELQGLSTLEERLLSQRYPFMKLLALPKDRQYAIKGAVVNIPVDVENVAKTLPKTPSEAGIIPLKLKRKIEYQGHYSFQYIRPHKISSALSWLLENNCLYENVMLNSNWENDCIVDDTNAWNDLTGNEMENMENQQEDATSADSNSENDTDIEDDSMDNVFPVCDETSQSIQLETCVQPADLSIDASRIMSIAPGERKNL